MRKLSAILLISIFTFSQYARQLSWLECKFSNHFKISAVKCDCEKQAGFDKQNNDQPPLSKIHTHIHPDEFFSVAKGIVIVPYLKIVNVDFNFLNAADECEGSHPTPWRPPNT